MSMWEDGFAAEPFSLRRDLGLFSLIICRSCVDSVVVTDMKNPSPKSIGMHVVMT